MKAIYKTMKKEILESLKEGVAPWIKPWCAEIPKNAVTKRPYNGTNVLALWSALEKHQYKTNLWLTFKQAKDANLSVKQGEKGTCISFAKVNAIYENDKKNIFMGEFLIFNLDQLTGKQENLDTLYPVRSVVDEGLFASAKQRIDLIGANLV